MEKTIIINIRVKPNTERYNKTLKAQQYFNVEGCRLYDRLLNSLNNLIEFERTQTINALKMQQDAEKILKEIKTGEK
jgi:hypothetical protein